MFDGERTWRPEESLPQVVGAVGLVATVVGTFLPWLRSGAHERNSYQAGGAVRRLVEPSGVVDHLLALWPFVGIACAASIALYLFRVRAPAVVLGCASALGAGAAAIAALATTATSFAEVEVIGPATTLTGATLVALAVLLRALSAAAAPRRSS